MVGLVMAISPTNGIGKDNNLLYTNVQDMKLFRENTKDKVVIMGRKTWESLPKKPLSDRVNVVVTSKPPLDELKYENTHFITAKKCDELIDFCKGILKDKDVYIIGGAKLIERYKDKIDFMYISHFKEDKEADTFFPEIELKDFYNTYEEDFGEFVYREYTKATEEEEKIIRILKNGK